MAVPLISPPQILDSYRKSDAVLIVCQNNVKEMIEIVAVNSEAEQILGIGSESLAGKNFADILPERIASTLAEFVEYRDDGNDLLTVLGKVRVFSMKTASGAEPEFKLRVIRGESIDRNPWFHLVLTDEEKQRSVNAFRETIRKDFESNESADARSGLANRLSVLKNLELAAGLVREGKIAASFAILDINQYESLVKEHGADIAAQLYRHIGALCKLRLRSEDRVGSLSERSIGILLVEAQQEPARMVLNRLRWAIGATPLELPKKDLVAQVNVSFAPIDGKISGTDVLEKCEAYSVNQRRQISNSVQLVVTHERREGKGTDRRKVNIPVAVDRRKRDRRKG